MDIETMAPVDDLEALFAVEEEEQLIVAGPPKKGDDDNV